MTCDAIGAYPIWRGRWVDSYTDESMERQIVDRLIDDGILHPTQRHSTEPRTLSASRGRA
jgi:hypothetical protein